MRIALIVAGLLCSLVAQPQDIYRWVDKNGTVHYADQPGAPDAQLVEVTPPAGDAGDDAPPGYDYARPREPAERPPYRRLSITSPAHDAAYFAGDTGVPVTVEPDAPLRPGDEVGIFLDGARVSSGSGLSTTLTGLTRGSHTLHAAILDAAGSVLITSPRVVFHMRRPSIATPPVGPTLRPPPPPPPPRPTPPGT